MDNTRLELPLGDRMKMYEGQFENRIKHTDYIVCRLDGHKFSKYTKGWVKPFDEILSKAMQKASEGLLERFGAVTTYTQSDEITMIFTPQFQEKNGEISNNQVLAGRIQKMASLLASYATMEFNKFISNWYYTTLLADMSIGKLADKIGNAHFDCRVYGVESKEEAFNSVMWRVRDAVKNSKSMFAQNYCSHKSLLNKTADEQLEYTYSNTGEDWNKIEDRYKFGILTKKSQYLKELPDGDSVVRSRTESWSEKLTQFDPDLVDLITRKYKTEVE
jgi:tRNA(His) guanylyltransferase